MFENRSFDHILGHLSFERINTEVNGLRSPLRDFSNPYLGNSYSAYSMRGDLPLTSDLPHETEEVERQLAKSEVSGKYTMSGFVEEYAKLVGTPNLQALPMGFFKSGQVPVSNFIATNYCVCDNWFASLPGSTQPNRNMAFFGNSNSHLTRSTIIDMDNSVFDWLTKHQIRWRVYHDGISFFILYRKQWKHVFGPNFRRYERLASDMINEPAETAPQVIFVEPSYQSAPHIGSDRPNDNHAPLAIGWGEEFLRNTYRALISNAEKWAGTVMLTYYDEHGGFYDHVPPPAIPYTTLSTAHKFDSLGVRVPAMVASPLVKPGSICNKLFDHTSVLQMLEEKFAPGNPISETVTARKNAGIASLTAALTNNEELTTAAQPPSIPINVNTILGRSVSVAPSKQC